jgi:hypothetical protein
MQIPLRSSREERFWGGCGPLVLGGAEEKNAEMAVEKCPVAFSPFRSASFPGPPLAVSAALFFDEKQSRFGDDAVDSAESHFRRTGLVVVCPRKNSFQRLHSRLAYRVLGVLAVAKLSALKGEMSSIQL